MQAVLSPCRGLRDKETTFGAIVETEKEGSEVLCLDRNTLRFALCACEGLDVTLWALAGWMDRVEIS